MRARDDADLSGAILNPFFCAIKISPLTTTRASISLSLSLLFERFQSSRERDERERRARVVSERTISSFDCLFERFSSNFFSHQIIVSLERKRTHFSLSREKMSRVRCKIPDTKSTPKRLHANKKTKRARQFRTVCASENIFITCMSFSLRALKRVCL